LSKLSTIREALKDFKEGKIIIVIDDEDRENEGDFICAAELCTPETMNVMIKYGSGFVCAPTTPERLRKLSIPMMVEANSSRLGTAMTVTVDASVGTTTGVSAVDRSTTVRKLADPEARGTDFTKPGHIVPLRAAPGGVLRRAGHTEASVDLCRLAGLQPMGVLAEVMNDDGTMARTPELFKIAEKFNYKVITIADLIAYRRKTERLIERIATTKLPTKDYGEVTVHAYTSEIWTQPAIALVWGDLAGDEPPLVRVHSSCVTGDLLSSLRCDCGDQLHAAMQAMSDEGRGALIYLEQEGRGIGLVAKMRAYQLQEAGLDTVEANQQLGFKPDLRDYGIGAQIMSDLGLEKIRFMTNNPAKVRGIDGYNIEIVDWVPIQVKPNEHNAKYLETKRGKMGHIFPVDMVPEEVQK
jgi:3,4-dihydroxy 2-butanone 4-phosphate synthase / GTP cyclohydrolase II